MSTPAPYFNPRPPRGGRQQPPQIQAAENAISIHAPLAGGDRQRSRYNAARDISIHAPLAGGDGPPKIRWERFYISIHAPLAGGDNPRITFAHANHYFNPRPPRGGRPCMISPLTINQKISIHAPLAGGDALAVLPQCQGADFNPRPPRGGRLGGVGPGWGCPYFNPRPPRGGRLAPLSKGAVAAGISIHAPLAGGDAVLQHIPGLTLDISIHAPLAGGDSKSAQVWSALLFKAENISGDYTALGVLYRIFFPKTTLPQGNFRCEGAGAGVGAWASHAAGQIISVPSGR